MNDDQTAQDPNLRSLKITAGAFNADMELDGQDITKAVRGYSIQHMSGEPATVIMQLSGRNSVLFDGVARVVVGEPAVDAAAFLSGIDAAALDEAALNRDLDGQPGELTRAMLAQLIEWAQGVQ